MFERPRERRVRIGTCDVHVAARVGLAQLCIRYRIRPYILMYFLRSIKHTTSRFSAVEDCVLKNARLSAVETVGCRGNQGSKPRGACPKCRH